MISIYDEDSGRCKVCRAHTLWGEAPHDPDCEAAQLLDFFWKIHDAYETRRRLVDLYAQRNKR